MQNGNEVNMHKTTNADVRIINEIEKKLSISIPQLNVIRTGVIGYKLKNNRITALAINSINCQTVLEKIFTLENLELLILNDTEISSIPDSIGNLKKLSDLSLKQNVIEVVTEHLLNLPKLKYLNLSNNKLVKFRVNEGQLALIKSIELENNHLKIVEFEENSCFLLEGLFLNNNNISEININNLSNLKFFSIQYNNLTKIPDVENLTKLIGLEVDFNGITEFNNQIKSLKNLETLSISYNKIRRIDFTNGRFNKIPHFFFNGNPFDKASKKKLRQLVKVKSNSIFFV